jgi:hypothetical protein
MSEIFDIEQKPQESESHQKHVSTIKSNDLNERVSGDPEEPNREWFILRNNNHIGPFSQKKILEYYHQDVINEYSLIWKEGFEDWQPLKKVKDVYHIIEPEQKSEGSLPDLPDLRMIELEAQRELESEIPPPRINNKYVLDCSKRKKTMNDLEKGIDEVREDLKVESNSSSAIYESSFDEKSESFSRATVLDTSGIRVSLPPLPFDDDLEELTIDQSDLEVKASTVISEELSRQFIAPATPEILESREGGKWIYNLLFVGIVALFITIPLFYIVMSNRPVIHSIEGMSKEGMQRINLATSEMYNHQDIIFNMSLTNSSRLFAGINRSGSFDIRGLLTPVAKKTADSSTEPVVVMGESASGLIRLNRENTISKKFPVGLYKVSLNLADKSNIGKVYQFARHFPFLENVSFIRNYQRDFAINQEVWLGPHSIFLTKRYVEDYQKEIWENISRPFDGLFQNYDTLLSLMDRFNEVFFNATTAKTFAQSKVLFSRKYGREIAPILQMIATQDLTEEMIQDLSLPKSLVEVYREGIMLAKSVSKSVSATAGDVDIFLSVQKSWNRFIRIEQRNRLSRKLITFRKKIKSAKESLQKKVESLKQK